MINPEKPRKGFFEVRTKGKKVVSLGPMPRPFKAQQTNPMRASAAWSHELIMACVGREKLCKLSGVVCVFNMRQR